MKKIILMPTHNEKGNGGGIRVYNERLVDLFKNDKSINISIFNELSSDSILGNKYTYDKLRKRLIQEKPDIIHINGYTSLIPKQVISIARKINAKIIYTAHWHPFETMRLAVLKKLYFKIFIRPYLKYVDTIVAINNEEYAFFSKYHSNVKLVPHWMPKEVGVEKSMTRVPNMILFVGSPMMGNKHFDFMFHLPKDKYDIRCVGRDNIELREDMTQYKNISNEELAKLYSSASLLVVPSRYEAFSYVTLEALYAGTPVLVSDGVRIIDYLGNQTGVTVFKEGDVREFVDKIDIALKQSVDVEAIKHIFSQDEAFKQYKEIYIN